MGTVAIGEFGMVNPLPDLDWEAVQELLEFRISFWRMRNPTPRRKTVAELIEGMRRRTQAFSPKAKEEASLPPPPRRVVFFIYPRIIGMGRFHCH